MSDTKHTPGDVIYKARREQGMTQSDLASLVGTSNQQIGRLEKNQRAMTIFWAKSIGRALGLPARAILCPNDPLASDHGDHTHGRSLEIPLRDWFAGMAFQGIISRPDTKSNQAKYFADMAYEAADAMIKARGES